MKFRLDDNTFYTPDYFIQLPSGLIEVHEVKWATKKTNSAGMKVSKPLVEDDAAVKIKLAAEIYTLFRFFIVFKANGTWKRKEH